MQLCSIDAFTKRRKTHAAGRGLCGVERHHLECSQLCHESFVQLVGTVHVNDNMFGFHPLSFMRGCW